MIRFLLPLIEIGLLVYCLLDAITSDSDRVRNLPKIVWVLLIVLLPIVGGVAWLVAGRPERAPASRAPWPATRTSGFPEYERPTQAPRGPDDDPDFLRRLRRERDGATGPTDTPDEPSPGPQEDPPGGTPTR